MGELKKKERIAIAERLKEVGERLFGTGFGWKSRFADALGISSQQVTNLLSARVAPGNSVQARLRAIGADVEYIITGKSSGEQKKERERKSDDVIAFHAPGAMSEEQRRAIQRMLDDLSELKPGDIERAREIVKAAFRKKP